MLLFAELVGTAASMRWRDEDGLAWVRSPVFAPYLDHWCKALGAHAADAGGGTRGGARGAAGSMQYGGCDDDDEAVSASGRPASSSSPLPPFIAPLVWMTTNEQCVGVKPRKWRFQVKTMHAANSASVAAAKTAGLPLLDWTRMLNNSEACANKTIDGVHVQPWVDRLRTTILLGYLCADGDHRGGKNGGVGGFHSPCVRPNREWVALCARRESVRDHRLPPHVEHTSREHPARHADPDVALTEFWRRWASAVPLKGVLSGM